MKLALGTAQFGLSYGVANSAGQIDREVARQILSLARSSGIEVLDTAIAYGDSEARLGEIGVSGWRVISKLPAVPAECAGVGHWMIDSVRCSLRRLGVDRLEGLLLHRPAQLLEPRGPELYRTLQELKQDGLIGGFGVSVYGPDELDALAPRYTFDIVQAPFSIFDRRMVSSGWLSRLNEQGTQLHVRSIFLQGLLLMPASARPDKFHAWRSLLGEWDAWLADAELSPLQACLRYALGFPQIDTVIVGVDSPAHLTQIIRSSEGDLPAVPETLASSDPDLLNPSRWNTLT